MVNAVPRVHMVGIQVVGERGEHSRTHQIAPVIQATMVMTTVVPSAHLKTYR